MPNDAYEHMKLLLNVNKNSEIVSESELRANVRFLALMNASSRHYLSIHADECVFSRNELQKVYLLVADALGVNRSTARGIVEKGVLEKDHAAAETMRYLTK